ncbi:MAG: GNAT family N-acetyltransferase [Bacteroidetes bacterium]|nr:GNAT family N-acetyltransferase [Bacteroidota bacterium]
MQIKQATTDADIFKCYQVMKVLRPHLIEENFLSLIKEMMTEGYELAFAEEEGKAVSAIGYRYLQYLAKGKHIYIDDLVTIEEVRGKGHASQLLDYVFAIAKEKGYKAVTLDSAHYRFVAHKLYLNKGFNIVGHHFSADF